MQLFNLDDTTRGSQPGDARNIPGYEGTYKTLEFSANKRYTQPLVDERVVLVHLDRRVRQHLLQQPLRHGGRRNFSLFGSFPTNPNEQTLNEFTNWNAKFSGTVDAGWGMRVTPVLKMQSGAPYGRLHRRPT